MMDTRSSRSALERHEGALQEVDEVTERAEGARRPWPVDAWTGARKAQRMAESTRHPLGSRDDAELLHLIGIARLRAGDPAKALDALVAAVAIAPDLAYGDPYHVAGEALAKLKRWDEAEDALERFVETNHSSVAGWVKLARVRAKKDDATGAKEAIAEAKTTWAGLPSFKRRHEWSWWLASVASPLWLGIA